MINTCRKTIVNPSNFNIKKQYRIVFFYLCRKLNITMLPINVTSKSKQQEGVINISFINERFKFKRKIFEPNLFMITERNIGKSWS